MTRFPLFYNDLLAFDFAVGRDIIALYRWQSALAMALVFLLPVPAIWAAHSLIFDIGFWGALVLLSAGGTGIALSLRRAMENTRGWHIHRAYITAFFGHAEELAGPQAVHHKKRMRTLQAAARKMAFDRLTDYRKAFHPFGAELISFYNDGSERGYSAEEYDRRKAWIVEQAKLCLEQFEELFDVGTLPPAYEYDLDLHPNEQVRLARAHHSLRELAAGDLQVVDPESYNPLNQEDDYIDRWHVERIIWLLDDIDVGARNLRRLPKAAPAKLDRPTRRLQSLEICTGAGGQAIGLHAAGFDALGLYEINPHAVATLRANRRLGPVHQADVRKVDFKRYRGHVDLLAGGVPCQPFSAMGKQQGRNDKRDLFLETVRIVDEVQPRVSPVWRTGLQPAAPTSPHSKPSQPANEDPGSVLFP